MPTINPTDQAVIDRARAAAAELVEFTRTPAVAGCKHRGEVSSRAKWLLAALVKLETDLGTDPAPTRPAPSPRARRGGKAKIRLAPIAEYEPKIRNAYDLVKSLGLLDRARAAAGSDPDWDGAFMAVRELVPVTSRRVFDWFDEADCRTLVSLCLDSELYEAGVEYV